VRKLVEVGASSMIFAEGVQLEGSHGKLMYTLPSISRMAERVIPKTRLNKRSKDGQHEKFD